MILLFDDDIALEMCWSRESAAVGRVDALVTEFSSRLCIHKCGKKGKRVRSKMLLSGSSMTKLNPGLVLARPSIRSRARSLDSGAMQPATRKIVLDGAPNAVCWARDAEIRSHDLQSRYSA